MLFQGDSITDAHHDEADFTPNSAAALGDGYVFMIASQLLISRHASGLKLYNRGDSGDKVYDLADRWEQDCLSLKPDVLSILIGVNDFWQPLKGGYDGTLEDYRRDYRALLQQTRASLPNVKLVLCEPFALWTGVVDDRWFPSFAGFRAAARELANEFADVWVAYQQVFDEAAKFAEPKRWLYDGVHPTPDGAALMAAEWLRAVGE